MTQKFKDHPKVVFGDSSLSGGGARGGSTANPGAGGWPTIRYYNKETGTDGANYNKKTGMAICDELGPKGAKMGKNGFMVDYVVEAGKISLCAIETLEGCGEKEITYIEKMNAAIVSGSHGHVAKQLARLQSMQGNTMKDDLKEWLNQRLAILEQFAAKDAASEAKQEL